MLYIFCAVVFYILVLFPAMSLMECTLCIQTLDLHSNKKKEIPNTARCLETPCLTLYILIFQLYFNLNNFQWYRLLYNADVYTLICSISCALLRSTIYKQPTKCTSMFMMYFIHYVLTNMFLLLLQPSLRWYY